MQLLGPMGNKVLGALVDRTWKKFTSSPAKTRSAGSGTGITTQHDVVTQYRKRSMPKRKKRRWIRKIKAFKAMNQKLVGTTSIVRNDTLQNSFLNEGNNQNYLICHLYGSFGADVTNREQGTRDIYSMSQNDDRIETGNTTMQFTGACLDITGRNTGDLPLEVDMYIIVHKGLKHRASTESEFVVAQSTVDIPDGAQPLVTSDPTMSDRGMTPFQMPYWSKYGNTILKKVKYFLPVDSTFTYQWKDPRNYTVDLALVRDFGSNFVAQKGMTKTLLFVFKPLVGSPTTGETRTARLTIGHTRTYAYKIYQDNKDFNTLILA